MIKKRLIILLPLIGLFISCDQNQSFISIENIRVVKTSRDSLYVFKEKPYTGQVKKINDQGVVVESFFVREGKLNGEYSIKYNSGEGLKDLRNYSKGLPQGSWISFYENGQKKEQVNYVNGYMQGVRKSYWNNGLVKEENEFDRGILTGVSNFYYSNGQLRKTIAFDFNGNRDGVWLDYFPNGQIKQKISYKSGKIIDSLVRYNREGEID
ncbi:MAG: hypothetical protein VW127_07225 [Flavobacteriaceae bacterium]